MGRRTVESFTGSMGSFCRNYSFLPQDIPRVAKLDWNAVARRVFIDPVTGIVALMSPSSEHEDHSRGVDRLVDAMSRIFGDRSINLGSTRWRRPGDPEDSGIEPDACYYFGARAEARAQARQQGPEALAAFEGANPPDLVVEVERSHGDKRKRSYYREIGVREMWRLDLSPDGLVVDILDLGAEEKPERRESSAVLPLCTPDFVRAALNLAVDGRLRELDDLIDRAASALEEEWRPPEPTPLVGSGEAD